MNTNHVMESLELVTIYAVQIRAGELCNLQCDVDDVSFVVFKR